MIVGLTGGIGSGKTTVAKLFYKLGVPIYVSDIEAKHLMVNNVKLIESIKKLLGEESYIEGKLNRSYISHQVFNNKVLLSALNDLVHPIVAKDFKEWYAVQEFPYVIKESAILFETKGDKDCDLVITVTAPLEERINRVVKRDDVEEKQVKSRIDNQISDEEKMKQSQFVIHNITLSKTKKEIFKIHKRILKLT